MQFWASIILHWGLWGPTQNLGPISSAVLTFLGYNHTDKQGVYIDFVYWSSHVFEKQTERKDLSTKWTKKNMWQKREEERTENSFKISITLLIQISTKKRSDYYLKRIFILESKNLGSKEPCLFLISHSYGTKWICLVTSNVYCKYK